MAAVLASVAALDVPGAAASVPRSSIAITASPGPAAAIGTYQLRGIVQAWSDDFTDTANAQSYGEVSCPAQTIAVGGGVFVGGGIGQAMNSSGPLPNGTGWFGWVSNTTSTSGFFEVGVVCVRRVPGYTIVQGALVANGPGTQAAARVSCPAGLRPLGGGGYTDASDPQVMLNSSGPTASGWKVIDDNAGLGSNTVSAFAVCGKKPLGYQQIVGTSTTIAPGDQDFDSAECPSGTLLVGGGGSTSSHSTAVGLNSSYPSDQTIWRAYENNASASPIIVTATAICSS